MTTQTHVLNARGRAILAATLLVAVPSLGACSAAQRVTEVALRPGAGSSVSGTVRLIALDVDSTRLEIRVQNAASESMPVHVHEGHCGAITPQPRFPLESIVDGHSTTEVPAPMDELVTLPFTVNVHQSNEHLDILVACADLAPVAAGAGSPGPVGTMGPMDHAAMGRN